MAFRPLIPFLVVLALAAAGCTSREAGPTSTSTSDPGLVPIGGGGEVGNDTASAPKPSAATMNLSRDPVNIEESGDMMGGVSKEWSWHVAPGFKTFSVELRIDGTQGAPTFTTVDLAYALTGGDPPAEVVNERWGVYGSSSHCVLCLTGDDLETPAGQWQLTLSSSQSAAEYSVRIVVGY